MAHVLVKNLSANTFGQFVNVANTIFLVPLYLSAWGVTLYGEWLVLNAVPAYFAATADAGFVPVSGNDMTIKFAQGRQEEVVSIFQSAWIFTTVLSVVVVTGISAVLGAIGISRLLDLTAMPAAQATPVLFCFLAVCMLNFQQGMIQVALRAIGRYAEGSAAYNFVTLVESLAIAGALLLHATPALVATLPLFTRVAAILLNAKMLRRHAPWLRYGIAQARWSELKRLFLPSIAALGIPAGNATMLQGVTLVLNHMVGPASVALFSTTRTMTRVVIQAIGLLSWSSWPEISRHYGSGRRDLLGAFLIHGTQIAAILAFGSAIVLVGGAPLIFAIWTGGKIAPDRLLVLILMLASVAATFRAFPATIIVATNRHVGFSGWYVLLCLGAAGACYPALALFGVVGAALSVATAEIAILVLSFAIALTVIGDGLTPLGRILTTRPPIERLLLRK